MNNEKSVFRFIAAISVIVVVLVSWLYSLPPAEKIPSYALLLPKINAMINGTASVLLLTSFYYIKKKNIAMHKRLNITAFLLSCIFMISYVHFHSFGIETKFPADNPLRPLYLVILLTHIVLAALVLPLVLLTFYLGLSMKVERHRKIARWTFPLWLYVTISGVVVYILIAPYYEIQ